MAKKNIALGNAIRRAAGLNPAFGRKIDKLPHNSPQRLKMAKAKGKRK